MHILLLCIAAQNRKNYLKLEILPWLQLYQLRCYRRRGTQWYLCPRLDMLAALTQENIFCAACATSDASDAGGATVVASHRRNSRARVEYLSLVGLRRS